MANIYNVVLNKNTHNYDGEEWVIDGENGRASFPGYWDISDARAHYMENIPVCCPTSRIATYTIRIDGKIYALAMDVFATTVFGIGPDRGKASDRIHTVDDRNSAILRICSPYDSFRAARDIAESSGVYRGTLYTK